MDNPDSLIELHQKYIKHTSEKAIVADITILLAYLPKALVKARIFKNQKVYINTRILKHLYDKKPSEEFDTILAHLPRLINLGEEVYKNLKSKRGDFCVVGKIKGVKYICSIEVDDEANFAVTAFKLRDEAYLKKYKILWSRKDGTPSS